MAVGQVTIIKENLAQGGLKSVERTTLFIGLGGTGAQLDQVLNINQQTKLDDVLGTGESALKTQIAAAALNAGPNFTAYAIALSGEPKRMEWADAIEFALDAPNNIYPEKIAICDAVTTVETVGELFAAQVAAENTFAKYVAIVAAVPGIGTDETWSDYLAKTKALAQGAAYDTVSLVPLLHGNDLGVICGRLDNDSYSLGDSPMRVASGSVVGLGSAPVDELGLPLTMAHLKDLSDARFSVPQWYTNFDGMYWADHPTLDAEGGDFQMYENLRVWQYVARRVRVLMIQKIADRSFNQGAASTNYHVGYFLQPVIEASQGTTINGAPRSGLVQSPVEDDCVITWPSRNEVELALSVAPYGSPKKITGRIALDLNRVPAE